MVKTLERPRSVLFLGILGAVSLLLVPRGLQGDSIVAGEDLFVTQGTSSSTQSFASDPLPAGFFGPGSEPFSGTVRLSGAPLGAFGGRDVGDTDTVVRRPTDANLPGPGSSGTIPIELVALNLVSLNPITVTYNGGQNTKQWDVRIVLDPDPNHSTTGQMTIHHDSAGGGTFDSFFDIWYRIDFTPAGLPSTLRQSSFRHVSLTQPSAPWTHAIPNGVFPSDNNFYPGGDPNDPNNLVHVFYLGQLSLELSLTPVPEPLTATLAALGTIFLIPRGRRRSSHGGR